jgi:tRNA-dihydrouridine synthase A
VVVLLLLLLLSQLNGGITTAHAVTQALNMTPDSTFGIGPGSLDGVMIGRAAYNDPWGVLGDADVSVFGAEQNGAANRRQVVQEYCRYGDAMLGR